MRVLWIVLILFGLFFGVFAIAGAITAGRADDQAERIWNEMLKQKGERNAGISSREDS